MRVIDVCECGKVLRDGVAVSNLAVPLAELPIAHDYRRAEDKGEQPGLFDPPAEETME